MDLIGRTAELARLAAALDAAAGRGDTLVLYGQPGVGKSALLRAALTEGARRGLLVLTAVAVEDEFGLPYAGLHLLAGSFPEPGRGGLIDAITHERPPAKVAQLLLELLGDLGAVLLAVDDAQWLDPQSWQVLSFVAHRIRHDPVLLLLTMRESQAAQDRLDESGLTVETVEPLGTTAAVALLDRDRPGLAADERAQVLAEAGGNPLGLLELAPGDGAGRPLPARLEHAFAGAVRDLPPATRLLVQVAALNDGNGVDETVTAAQRLMPSVSPADLLAANLLIVDGAALRFRHPLVRSGVRQAIGSVLRREIHAAIAAGLDAEPGRQIWHRVEAADGTDEDLSDELGRLGRTLQEHESAAVAVRAYEKAARLTADPKKRTVLLWLAFDASMDLGGPEAARWVLAELSAQALTAGDRAMLAYFEQIGTVSSGAPANLAAHLADTVASFLADGLTETARESLRHFSLEAFWTNPDADTRRRVGAMIDRMPFPPDDPIVSAALGLWTPLENGAEVARRLRGYRDEPPSVHAMSMTAMSIGALPIARSLLTRAMAIYGDLGTVGVVAEELSLRSLIDAQLGRVARAEIAAADARVRNAELGMSFCAVLADLARGRVVALRGDAVAARAVADACEQELMPQGDHPTLAFVQLIRGTAALAEGEPGRAFHELAPLFDPAALPYHHAFRFWGVASLAEAAMACGREEQLRDLVDELTPLDRPHNAVLTVGLAYARAVLADTEETYAAALAIGGLAEWPFETARLRYAYGRRLRRRRRVTEARDQLRAAADAFTELGATPWAERADAELRATGERVERDTGPDARQLLTPQELQIAQLAAEGLTSRAIAAQLFLSARTVDSHLYRTYRKVGVSSRAELSRALALGTG